VLEQINALIDADVTDVFIGSATGVWLQRPKGVSRAPLNFTEEQVREFAVSLIDLGGRHIDDAMPCVDVRLGGGVRVHAVLSPVSVHGTEISIRFPSGAIRSLEDWVCGGGLSSEAASRLKFAVEARHTILVSGATGAGKTSLLSCLMSAVDHGERIITIEDVAELQISHPRCVGLEVRQANTDGRGEISVADLVRQSLRMRPERLVVGECRGAEVVDMLRAFTTGHAGGGSTIHANSMSDVAVRLDSLAALAGMDSEALARLATAAIDLVIHISCDAGIRHVTVGKLVVVDGILRAVQSPPLSAPQSARLNPTNEA
jgi:pilus assembly protein CpaF